jgi:hypothetical protein
LSDDLPIACHHRGVAIFAGQSAQRVRRVKLEIDRVHRISDPVRLAQIAADCSWSPEARIYSAARCLGGLQRAVERREAKPAIDPERVAACAAGLSTVRWQHPNRYCSLFDVDDERAAVREQPLEDLE